MCVPGAMAATSAAIVRMNPAEAARAPDGADEDRHRRLGGDHARDDGPRGIEQPAGRAQREHDQRRPRAIGAVERVDHVFGGDRVDDAVNDGGVDDGAAGRPGLWRLGGQTGAPATRTLRGGVGPGGG